MVTRTKVGCKTKSFVKNHLLQVKYILTVILPNLLAINKVVIKLFYNFSWTNDGQYLALGLFNGTVSIRSKVSFQLPSYCYTTVCNNGYNVMEQTVRGLALREAIVNPRGLG